MRTANPALNNDAFSHVGRLLEGSRDSETMTIQGTTNKTFVLLGLCLATACYTWKLAYGPEAYLVGRMMMLGIFGGLICALVTIFKKTAAPISAPLYALFEGLAMGGISAHFEARFPGIVIQAVGLTFGTLFALLAAYKSRIIQPSENFKLGIAAATGAICLLYLVEMGIGFFGIRVPLIHESGLIGIGFSLFVVAIAAFNLVLDFDFIENGAAQGAPKYMEWYGAFGLMVTLIWLYLELLRLLAKSRSRR
ncbi:MAG: hypothetical protein A2X36_02600 [Elusimicrobia bacterium GWA2_69_24]|nr:MAG: hypothetical protein A2X36_02600 [Elusimicrobia bacterium GWA2_69_24]HBL15553.1 hypothetical protein [Elusimicrobiota bacterium]